MPKWKADNRTRLLQAAEKVTYRHGFRSTALADIAKEARVPLGNIYYYFKTKDAIGNALVERRVSRFRRLLQELDKADSPKERLCGFVQIKINNREELARSGCPVGTMCSELHKHGGAVAKKSTVLFAEALAWRLWRGWRRSSRRWAKGTIRTGLLCTFSPQRKASPFWLTPSTIPV
jgi:TetR/AcrR family transcriptional repressor of nem operon